MITSIAVCLGSVCGVIWLVRRSGLSLGLPAAYLFGLLLIHIPGAFAHLIGGDILGNSELTELGIWFTAIGCVCFVVGVWYARRSSVKTTVRRSVDYHKFSLFCLIGGWVFIYPLSFVARIPSLGAAVEKGGAIWMLGAILGLRMAMMRGDWSWVGFWLGTLALYTTLTLLLGGFLAYGATAVTIVLSVLVVSTRRVLRMTVAVIVVAVLGINIFLSYFANRPEIRSAVWGGAAMETRIDVALDIFRDFEWFDPTNEEHLRSIDARLNQNFFAGLAAMRIQDGAVDHLYGQSLWEGLISLVPRALWPDKPVFGGSGNIVADMTGLYLDENTSWGVGNVMEFQINFGIPGLVVGFLALGWLIGWLDRKAAVAERSGDLGRTIIYFLPAVALIQPNGSMVELASGSAAALLGAYGWKKAWEFWSQRHPQGAMIPQAHARNRL